MSFPVILIVIANLVFLSLGIGQIKAATNILPPHPQRDIEGFIEVSPEEAILTFQHLAASIKSNYEMLRTWRGECVGTIWWRPRSADGDDDSAKAASTVITRRRHKFATNLITNSIATSYERIEQGSSDSVIGSGKSHVYPAYKQIATSDYSMTYAPGMLTTGFAQLGTRQIPPNERINITARKGEEFTFLGDRLDPRLYFGTTHISPLWELYEENAQGLMQEGAVLERMLKYVRVSKRIDGERVLHRVAFLDINNGALINENFHDSDVGSNIVRAVDWYGDKKVDLTKPRLWYHWDYKEVDGIFLPSKFYSEDRGAQSRCELIFSQLRLMVTLKKANLQWHLLAHQTALTLWMIRSRRFTKLPAPN